LTCKSKYSLTPFERTFFDVAVCDQSVASHLECQQCNRATIHAVLIVAKVANDQGRITTLGRLVAEVTAKGWKEDGGA
jgi:hypothetical protein